VTRRWSLSGNASPTAGSTSGRAAIPSAAGCFATTTRAERRPQRRSTCASLIWRGSTQTVAATCRRSAVTPAFVIVENTFERWSYWRKTLAQPKTTTRLTRINALVSRTPVEVKHSDAPAGIAARRRSSGSFRHSDEMQQCHRTGRKTARWGWAESGCSQTIGADLYSTGCGRVAGRRQSREVRV
jgi:hypothetical protein